MNDLLAFMMLLVGLVMLVFGMAVPIAITAFDMTREQ